jgi:branched-chain amino acid transport system ATP-binding protein
MTPAGAPLLACRDVSKHFGALAAVSKLSFEVASGEVLGIGGPNGAGKTTLFEVVSGMTATSAGEVLFDGRPITGLPPERICHAGIARTFQLNAAFDSLTVRENVAVAAHFGQRNRHTPGLRLERATKERVDAALDFVGLAGKGEQVARRLPVLERKLLMIASALATEPKLLLLDEPVGGLNPGEIDLVASIVERLRASGITILLIEHVMRFLVRLSTRVLIMHHGEKIYEGSAAGLVRDVTVIDVYLGAGTSARLRAAMEAEA